MKARGLLLAAACLLAAFAAAATPREPLTRVSVGELPPLPPAAASARLASVDKHLVALGEGSAWTLAEGGKEWRAGEWKSAGAITAIARGATYTYLLLGDAPGGPATRVARLTATTGVASLGAAIALPAPLAKARGGMLGDTLYVAGMREGGKPQLLAIDALSTAPAWREVPAWPGGGEPVALVGQTQALQLVVRERAIEKVYRWKAADGWLDRGDVPGTFLEGSVRASGQGHLLGLLRDAAGQARFASYQTITAAWVTLARTPAGDAKSVAAWGNGLAWHGGAVAGFSHIEDTKLLLEWLDWIIIVVYLTSMVGMGLYFYLKEKRQNTADFFVGGRSIPFWAAGVSLYATNTSSISYIAIPAKAFETNWTYLANNLVAVCGLMFVAVWIVPLLRRLNLMSVFHYLEIRFHPVIRTLSSLLCILVQIGSRMSVILFLPSLAIATITGIPVTWSIGMMGVFTMIYTAMGGMKAVIWTDFVQLIVKMGGIAFAIGFVVWNLDGGWGELFAVAAQEEKMKLLDFSFDLTRATVWGFIFLVVFDVVLTFPKDQVLMQRVLSTKNSKDAGKSIWTFAAIMIPGGFMFYFVGTALYAFYKSHPERMNPLLSVDATFPLFIAAELPMGVKGLIIAGIFAAAMATLSSIMNSVATLASVDFFERMVKNPTPKQSVFFAEAMTVVTGLVGMAAALVLARYDILSLFDVSIELAGLLGGGFAGAYTLGMFTRRANWQGVAIGVVAAIALTGVAWSMSLVHPYFYLGISIMVCIVVGYAASWFFPPHPGSLEGLTIYDKR